MDENGLRQMICDEIDGMEVGFVESYGHTYYLADHCADDIAYRAARAITAAGLTVVELPQPAVTESAPRWFDGDVWASPGSNKVRVELQDHRLFASEARELAAALLAAADVAEGNDEA